MVLSCTDFPQGLLVCSDDLSSFPREQDVQACCASEIRGRMKARIKPRAPRKRLQTSGLAFGEAAVEGQKPPHPAPCRRQGCPGPALRGQCPSNLRGRGGGS